MDIRKRAAQRQVMDEYRVSPKKACVPLISTDLQGKQVCVLHGSAEVCAQRIREIIESFGGSYVANPSKHSVIVGLLSGETMMLLVPRLWRKSYLFVYFFIYLFFYLFAYLSVCFIYF